jgi:hypothetical protein
MTRAFMFCSFLIGGAAKLQFQLLGYFPGLICSFSLFNPLDFPRLEITQYYYSLSFARFQHCSA